jgi:hypothetical protein
MSIFLRGGKKSFLGRKCKSEEIRDYVLSVMKIHPPLGIGARLHKLSLLKHILPIVILVTKYIKSSVFECID